jgi:predicted enzyme related to lactoylglutathione lyase
MNEHDRHINYIELPTTDMAATQRFYGDVFEWTFTDYGPDYASFSAAEAGVDGGFRADGEVTPAPAGSGVLVVLYAEDLEATQQRVRAAGAEIVKPIFSFPGGRRFHFRDPGGNELAVWSEK